jgi:hypothetical protein
LAAISLPLVLNVPDFRGFGKRGMCGASAFLKKIHRKVEEAEKGKRFFLKTFSTAGLWFDLALW